KLIMQHVSPAQLVGIDPSSAFIDMAGKAFAGEPRVSFATGDATATGQVDGLLRPYYRAHGLLASGRAGAGAGGGPPGSQAGWAARYFRRRLCNAHRRPVRWRSAAGSCGHGAAESGARTVRHAAAPRSRRRSGVQRAVGRAP